MSTKIPLSAEGLTKIAAAAGQAGIAQKELLTFTKDAAVMAIAFGMSAEDAGSAMTGMRTNFKLTQDEVRLLGDGINALSNSMDAKAPELVDFVSRVGGTAATFRMTGQGAAAKTSSLGVRLLGSAWKFALGPIGLVITVMELWYNSFSLFLFLQ